MSWGAAVAAGINLVSSFKENVDNKKAATKQRNWEANMSNTAYQRGMADMKKAGLNPILAYKQGGASTPTTQAHKVVGVADKAVNSAIAAYQAEANVDNTNANTDLIKEKTISEKRDNYTGKIIMDIVDPQLQKLAEKIKSIIDDPGSSAQQVEEAEKKLKKILKSNTQQKIAESSRHYTKRYQGAKFKKRPPKNDSVGSWWQQNYSEYFN